MFNKFRGLLFLLLTTSFCFSKGEYEFINSGLRNRSLEKIEQSFLVDSDFALYQIKIDTLLQVGGDSLGIEFLSYIVNVKEAKRMQCFGAGINREKKSNPFSNFIKGCDSKKRFKFRAGVKRSIPEIFHLSLKSVPVYVYHKNLGWAFLSAVLVEKGIPKGLVLLKSAPLKGDSNSFTKKHIHGMTSNLWLEYYMVENTDEFEFSWFEF